MTVKHPKVNEVAPCHSGGGGQGFFDRQICKVQPVAEPLVGDWRIILPNQSDGPLKGRDADHRFHHLAFMKTRPPRIDRMNRETRRLKCLAVGPNQVIKAAGLACENVLTFNGTDTVLPDHRAVGKWAFGIPVAAYNRNDVLLELVKRHGRFLS